MLVDDWLVRPHMVSHQDETWHAGWHRPWPHCVRWGPAPSPKGAQPPPQFSAHIFCGQMAAWIKMSLGMEQGLGPGDFVLNGNPAPPPQNGGGGRSPKLSSHVYCGQTAGWMKVVLGKGVGLSPGDFVLDGHPALPPNKGGEAPSQLSAHFDCAQTSHDDGRKSLRRRRRSAGGRSDLSTTSQRPQNAAQRHVLSSAARRSAFRAVSRVLVTTSG